MKTCSLALATLISITATSWAEPPSKLSRCEILPLAGHQASLRIDGREQVRWHFGKQYPRPFFYPLNGPSGSPLTRMGHPGAPNHDHHRSIWFAHGKVNGKDFWSDTAESVIRQQQWLAYHDADDEAIMATRLGWYDAHREIMQQEVVAAVIPLADGEYAMELQITLHAPDEAAVQLDRTNFGLLAVRVAKSLSVHFGGGQLTNSESQSGEQQIFGQPARWMDYSGPVAVGRGSQRRSVVEGISFFDHPRNPRYPPKWHVREDGWMGASFCFDDGYTIPPGEPLLLRYLLHAHRGSYDHQQATEVHAAFARRPGFRVSKSTRPHRQYEVARRAPAGP